MRDSQKGDAEKESEGISDKRSKGARILQLPRMDEREPRVKGERAVLPRVSEKRKGDIRSRQRPYHTVETRVEVTSHGDKHSVFVPSVSQQEESDRGEDV